MPVRASDTTLRRLLAVDSAANYALGLPLLLAPDRTARLLALPETGNRFYARVLGGVLTGIAFALDLERSRNGADGVVGLGAGGAIAINTLGATAVAAWLASSEAARLPPRGRAALWAVAAGVTGIGAVEAWHELSTTGDSDRTVRAPGDPGSR
jgi:hypothetical protein